MARTKDFDEDEVLEKAMNLFWLKGYNGTSMQDLVDGLGISRSSLYDTYVDKHTLFLRSLEHYKEHTAGKMGKIIQNTPSAREKIRRMLEYIISELVRDKEHKGCFLVNAGVEMASQDKEVSTMLCENDRQVEGYFYDIIKHGQESGEIANKQDARVLAQFILNNVKGVRVTARSTADRRVFNDIISLTLSVLN
ncbi:TetR/AcrR family transcriptional regulator [Mucilaginibacter ginsenosidivorans]|uniref:TetR/AcrR family transcriptional regulator n=1 Tax=Mucilaginibacter ginsenosidivorans TaxID=398053 RepID=A0A5B8UYD1_9SPHI|nr:TetR/AcrR family transcriptional regulator [Mucilaginibacter ginsenosidivorans]QEC63351.1 TetR/AcrR family transcriptional regulator [Mucilaginibacter ginsenosidivorans]